MTIERVEKRFGITVKRVSLDRQIIEAQKGLQARQFFRGKASAQFSEDYPSVHLESSLYEDTDRFMDWGHFNSLDSLEVRHIAFEDNTMLRIESKSTTKTLSKEEINEARIIEGGLRDRAVFVWTPTDHEAKRKEIEDVIEKEKERLEDFRQIDNLSIEKSEEGYHLLVRTSGEMSQEDRVEFEEREKLRQERPFYGIKVVYSIAEELDQKSA